MGLFSNLFGESGKDIDNAFSKMKNLAEDLAQSEGQNKPQPGQTVSSISNSEPMGTARETATIVEGPSGDSWGPNMPAEENQFNSGLNYFDYFSGVFSGAFSQYQIDKESLKNGRAALFTFSQAGSKKLVVEVISQSSNPYKLRNDCRAQGVPYLRYYYDHDGWWNTKSYVTRRTSKALGI